jgi:hypothetical protein
VTKAEGWYLDPFGRHEQRWFSDGRPTALVRDGDAEAQDAPPADAWDGPLEAPPELPSPPPPPDTEAGWDGTEDSAHYG